MCLWFGLGIRQARDTGKATAAIANQPPTAAAAFRRASSLLDSADTLNPDAEVSILRGRIELGEHHFARAQEILRAVTRREPMNLEAWIWLGGAALTNRPEAQLALQHIRELDPRN